MINYLTGLRWNKCAMGTGAQKIHTISATLLVLLSTTVFAVYISGVSIDSPLFTHVLFMTTSVLVLAIPSILTRQLKGKLPTKVHGLLMLASCMSSGYGWLCIHRLKDTNGKSHLLTWHGKAGAAMCLMLYLLSAVSMPLLDPDWRLTGDLAEKCRKSFKKPHKTAGRLWLLGVCGVWFSGLVKMNAWTSPGLWLVGASTAGLLLYTLKSGWKTKIDAKL